MKNKQYWKNIFLVFNEITFGANVQKNFHRPWWSILVFEGNVYGRSLCSKYVLKRWVWEWHSNVTIGIEAYYWLYCWIYSRSLWSKMLHCYNRSWCWILVALFQWSRARKCRHWWHLLVTVRLLKMRKTHFIYLTIKGALIWKMLNHLNEKITAWFIT